MLFFLWHAAKNGVLVVAEELASPLLLIVIVLDHVLNVLFSTRV